MAVDGYIRGAISQLESALNDLQAQIHDAQRNLDQQKHGLQQEIDGLDRERKVHEALAVGSADGAAQAFSVERLSHIHGESDDKKTRINQVDAELHALIQRKTDLSNMVRNYVSQLTSLLASADVH